MIEDLEREGLIRPLPGGDESGCGPGPCLSGGSRWKGSEPTAMCFQIRNKMVRDQKQ